MAGFYGRFIIEWECLKPEQYNEVKGETEWVANSMNQAKEQFLEKNPDYKVVSVTAKNEIVGKCTCCGEECFESDYPETVFSDEENIICENCSIDYEQVNGRVRKRTNHR